ncbi:hypothetical protein [Nocardia sp. 348MFTsu5.1]|uniref:hypothetical protein n=1 Tax=Nocardia sp. 348MFTsu5.1 TaxID=1172185 RepID=UPI000377FACA|nr:hypothetical protein [Nocardia sp. 348MFTsu5.1]
MICWSITAHVVTHPDAGILDAGANTTYSEANRSAGEAALVALADLAVGYPSSCPFVTISIDDTPVLLAAAGKDARGNVQIALLIDAVIEVRETGIAPPLAPTAW